MGQKGGAIVNRKHALTYMQIAGYHNDKARFTRLYIEQRVSLSSAREAFAKGQQLKAGGMPCTCYECQKAAQPPTLNLNAI